MTSMLTHARPRIASGIDELVGHTPLLRLPVPGAPGDVTLLGKLESANPLSSVKDRVALSMLNGAEASGRLLPGGTVIEATSGNTGIALAALSAARGYRCVVVLPDSATAERKGLLTALGAELVLTPGVLRTQGTMDKAEELSRAIPGSCFLRQHMNPDNPGAHYTTTGPEIWADTEGRVDLLVCGVGTGGTLCGTAAYLKEQNPALWVVALEPAGSPVLSGGEGGPHQIYGLNGGFVADTTDRSVIDEVLIVTDEEAHGTARRLAREMGVLAGMSSGAAVHGAQRVARRPENVGRTVVTILPDTGERYLSVWPT